MSRKVHYRERTVAVSVFLFDALLMQWIELMATEQDKCRNMDSVNPLKLINCIDL
ncbi:DUF2556 family protein, partial [Salmonella enterica subsp. enterica serovar Anatum]|nr:DUF2556 family protein [Salmonella enterica subsp. enterica serovar Anatum]